MKAMSQGRLPIPLFIPNILCYIRIILSFLSIITASQVNTSETPFRFICITSILWIISSILDHIDGKIARYFDQCSQFGVLIDIIADNILRGSTWMCVVVAALFSGASSGSKSIHSCDNNENASSRNGDNGDNPIGDGEESMLKMTYIAPMLGLFFISVEWMTMIASQMLTLLKEKRHWKDVGQHQKNPTQIKDQHHHEKYHDEIEIMEIIQTNDERIRLRQDATNKNELSSSMSQMYHLINSTATAIDLDIKLE